MQKLSNIGRRSMRKNILVACIIGILLSTAMVSIADSNDKKVSILPQTNYGDRTYYNAALFIISNVYYVRDFDEEKIDLSYRYPFLPGIFIVEDENGIQEFNLFGGWAGSRAEIYGFNGFFKWQGLYIVLIGNCTKISIIPVR
ncbi:MAG: hypothetical protein U9O96_06635 [Candidatus Thermoplasmatota archaeon]|nr:hypothetical protein [Candidatus Thermoplasmatota archaeon]